MNTEKLLAKFAAARTKQAQEEDPTPSEQAQSSGLTFSQQAPFGTLQYLIGNDPLSYFAIDPEHGEVVRNTVNLLPALAGYGAGKHLLQPVAPAAGRFVNTAVEASRYIDPWRRKNPISGNRSLAPTFADLLVDPNIDESIPRRALANVMPSLAPGGDAYAKNFQLFERPPARQAQPGTTQQPRTMDVTNVGNRLNRSDAMKLLTGSFLAPYMVPGGKGPNEPGRISYMGGGTPPSKKNPSGVPDAELESVTRQQLLTQRPALGLLDPRLIGEGAAPIRYVNPEQAASVIGTPNAGYVRPPVGVTNNGVVSPRENMLRRALGNTGNALQSVDPNSRLSKNIFGLGGALLASELPYYLGASKDVNPAPFLVDYPVR